MKPPGKRPFVPPNEQALSRPTDLQLNTLTSFLSPYTANNLFTLIVALSTNRPSPKGSAKGINTFDIWVKVFSFIMDTHLQYALTCNIKIALLQCLLTVPGRKATFARDKAVFKLGDKDSKSLETWEFNPKLQTGPQLAVLEFAAKLTQHISKVYVFQKGHTLTLCTEELDTHIHYTQRISACDQGPHNF